MRAINPASSEKPVVTQLAIVNGYALTTWVWGKGGGQAVLVNHQRGWSVISAHGGEMDEQILVAFGVPKATAASLVARLAAVPSPVSTGR